MLVNQKKKYYIYLQTPKKFSWNFFFGLSLFNVTLLEFLSTSCTSIIILDKLSKNSLHCNTNSTEMRNEIHLQIKGEIESSIADWKPQDTSPRIIKTWIAFR